MSMTNMADPKAKRFHIVSGGMNRTTKLMDADGKEVNLGAAGVSSIEIRPIKGGGSDFLQAVICIDFIGLGAPGRDVEHVENSIEMTSESLSGAKAVTKMQQDGLAASLKSGLPPQG